jgi:hypothetical protein
LVRSASRRATRALFSADTSALFAERTRSEMTASSRCRGSGPAHRLALLDSD